LSVIWWGCKICVLRRRAKKNTIIHPHQMTDKPATSTRGQTQNDIRTTHPPAGTSSNTPLPPVRPAARFSKKIISTDKCRKFFAFLCTIVFVHIQISSLEFNYVDNDKSLTTFGAVGWVRPKVIYGHIHMAKTAGTEINALLAMRYERVCGHKGYSYDFYQVNERHKQYSENYKNVKSILGKTKDIMSTSGLGGRDQIPMGIMQEVGFEDCDYISIEEPASTWRNLDLQLGGLPMEFHVRCRDPLSHLMSQCNFHNKKFKCESSELGYIHSQVQKCIDDFHNLRYGEALTKIPNATLKCFDRIPPSKYVDYMGNILQHRRIQGDYFHVDTNKPRSKANECLWNAGQDFQDKIRSVLIAYYEIYGFCEECMASGDRLPL